MEPQTNQKTDEQNLQLFKDMWPQNKKNLEILKIYTKKFLYKFFIDIVISAGDSLYFQL